MSTVFRIVVISCGDDVGQGLGKTHTGGSRGPSSVLILMLCTKVMAIHFLIMLYNLNTYYTFLLYVQDITNKNVFKKSVNHTHNWSREGAISHFSFCQMTLPILITNKWGTPQGLIGYRPRWSGDQLMSLNQPRAVLWGARMFFHKTLSTNPSAIQS